jgi:hypothetical protein
VQQATLVALVILVSHAPAAALGVRLRCVRTRLDTRTAHLAALIGLALQEAESAFQCARHEDLWPALVIRRFLMPPQAGPKTMPFRIAPEGRDDEGKNYLEKLLLLMPGEIVALYLAGRSAITGYFESIPKGESNIPESITWVVWTLVCIGLLVAFRRWGTSDKTRSIRPEWGAIAIAGVSFLVWVYSCGDVFKVALEIWNPLVATLLVMIWTFVTPAFYNPGRQRA